MKKQTTYILVGVALVIVAIYLYMKSKQASTPVVETETAPTPTPTPKKQTTTSTQSGIDRYKVLKLGSKGKEVEIIQKFLKPYSMNKIVVDGVFGKGTEGWLSSYKANKGIQGNPNVTSIYELNADGKSTPFGI